MTPAERDMFAPKGMSKRIGPESGRTVRSGVSVFRSPYGSVRYMLSEDGEPLSVLQVVETAPGTAIIAQVLTRPEFRRMGLASRLLERARKDYRQVLHSEHLTDEGAQWSKAVGNPGHSKKDIDVFSPKQVKAAFDNDGAFDRDSADVRKNPSTPEERLWDLVDETGSDLQVHGSGSVLWIDMLSVPETSRSRGTGSKIVRLLEQVARDEGFTIIRLYAADTGDGRSNRFWEQLGYDYDDDDDWYMRKALGR